MTARMKIPFLDLVAPHVELEEALISVCRNALRTAGFIGGPVVEAFEHDFAQFCGVKHCIGVGSGTDALRFALIAAGVRPGESVITAPNTFIATTEAISQAGALPEFVDIDERTYNIDPEKLCKYLDTECDTDADTGRPISRRTGRIISAVVPVHLYGQPANMDPILELAESYKLLVVEDACQAHGAEYFSRRSRNWMKAGSIGRAAAFSFYPGKNLGACGEAGAVTTNDPELAQKVRMLRDHGQAKKYYHDIEGYNGRLDAIQAGFLHAKLPHLATWNDKRRQNAETYQQLFSTAKGIVIPFEPLFSRSVYHLYVIRVREREKLQQFLTERGIGTGIHYPIPLHLQNAYRDLGYHEGDFPVAELTSREILSLPMFPGLTRNEQEHVVESITEHLGAQLQTTVRSEYADLFVEL
jgi:dTDP-4-amino-4,6-dideoxygalactose transaminase